MVRPCMWRPAEQWDDRLSEADARTFLATSKLRVSQRQAVIGHTIEAGLGQDRRNAPDPSEPRSGCT